MAPIAFILGGLFGMLSAIFGWLLFGLGLWGAVQVYFAVGLAVAALVIVVALVRPRGAAHQTEAETMQRA